MARKAKSKRKWTQWDWKKVDPDLQVIAGWLATVASVGMRYVGGTLIDEEGTTSVQPSWVSFDTECLYAMPVIKGMFGSVLFADHYSDCYRTVVPATYYVTFNSPQASQEKAESIKRRLDRWKHPGGRTDKSYLDMVRV